MPTYQYVNNSGTLSTVNANTANEALSTAQNIKSDSGVSLIPTPQGSSTIPTPPQSNVITPAALQNQTPITVPQANKSTTPAGWDAETYANFKAANPTLEPDAQDTYLMQNAGKPLNPTDTALAALDLTGNEQSAQNAQENIIGKMLQNITNQQGESAYRTDLTNQSGIAQQRKDLLGLSNQIRTKQAEIAQDDVTLVSKMRAEENRDTLLPFAQMGQAKLAGDAAIIRALKTSEIGVLNALAIGKQGDIQLAKDTINEAVDAKFAPYKEQNALYESQLKAIQPFLDKAEKKQALLQQTKLNLAMKEIDKVSDFQKTALTNAISNGAPQSVLNKINAATTLGEITSVGAGYLENKADRLSNTLKQLQINEANKKITDAGVISEKDLPLVVKSASDKINKIQGLIDNNKGLTASSGTLKRGAFLSGKIRDWRADISNVLSDLTVDELGRVKASGVTFGALSEGERKAVGDAASALSAAGDLDKNGRLTGYFNISEDKVRQELKTIQDYAKIDFERRTGVSYDDYLATQNAPVTEDSYVNSLLSSPSSSPFNIFSN
jgi:hypothetical protein